MAVAPTIPPRLRGGCLVGMAIVLRVFNLPGSPQGSVEPINGSPNNSLPLSKSGILRPTQPHQKDSSTLPSTDIERIPAAINNNILKARRQLTTPKSARPGVDQWINTG